MIFVTVGTQLPFDRLVRSIDQWAGAITSYALTSSCRSARLDYQADAHPVVPFHQMHRSFAAAFFEADVVVAHAGMGSIITALEMGKPILVMPRLAELKGNTATTTNSRPPSDCSLKAALPWPLTKAQLLEKLDDLDRLYGHGVHWCTGLQHHAVGHPGIHRRKTTHSVHSYFFRRKIFAHSGNHSNPQSRKPAGEGVIDSTKAAFATRWADLCRCLH